jgi:RNA polymerase sigma-70 factor (ECF subfamily)
MPQRVIRSADPTEGRLIAAAWAGDQEAFRRLTEPCYRELHLHCYRMLGSFHDAEDLVQETFLRAWRSLDTFAGRARFRTWLYQIATNACLKELARRPARVLPRDFGPPADPLLPPSPPAAEIVRLEPYPDALLGEVERTSADPEALYSFRESVELAFLAAIQLLAPRPRAVLLLRDVLGWRAAEVAALLESSVASVNSALQRARATLAQRHPRADRDGATAATSEAAERSLLARYMRAWEEGDMHALAALLREDAVLTMPPASTWLEGRAAIAAFFHALCFSGEPKRFRVLPTRANRQPACAPYEWDAGAGHYRFSGIMVLRLAGDLVVDISGFGDPALSALFGLPGVLGSDGVRR